MLAASCHSKHCLGETLKQKMFETRVAPLRAPPANYQCTPGRLGPPSGLPQGASSHVPDPAQPCIDRSAARSAAVEWIHWIHNNPQRMQPFLQKQRVTIGYCFPPTHPPDFGCRLTIIHHHHRLFTINTHYQLSLNGWWL